MYDEHSEKSTPDSDRGEIKSIGDALDAVESEMDRTGRTHDEDTDIETGEPCCLPDCLACERRRLKSRYRALKRKPILAMARKPKPIEPNTQAERDARSNELMRAIARYSNGERFSRYRWTAYGDLLARPKTTRQEIDLAAEIELRCLQAELHNAAVLLSERRTATRRANRQAAHEARHALLSNHRSASHDC